MAFSDKFRSLLGKMSDAPSVPTENASAKAPAPVPSPPRKPSKTMEEVDALIAQERKDAETRLLAIDKEMQAIRISFEKIELTSKTNRESNQQTLQYLQQDAEREMKFLERKLQEDAVLWQRQLAEREKAIEQAARQGEAGQLERKALYDKETENRDHALQRVEEALKEQEAKLVQERAAARAIVQGKDGEWLGLKQELARRESALDHELMEQENQRRAALELWQTRLKELERQWAEKRKSWEDAMKAKEEERLRVQNSLQEKEAAWRLEQDRRLQDMSRRQERAAEKVAALKAHLVKETQVWQTLSQTRDEQLQQLKVKLLLSESEAKGRTEQAQKNLQEAVANAAAQVQSVQHQIQSEQESWKKALEAKDVEMAGLQDQMRVKLRTIEADYAQRLEALGTLKNELSLQIVKLDEQHQQDKIRHEQRLDDLLQEQTILHGNSQKRLEDLKKRFDDESTTLQIQIQGFDRQKEDNEAVLATLQRQWQQQIAVKDKALKEAQAALAPQEAELNKRLAAEEEVYNRQLEALKGRGRVLERDIAKVHESAERAEKDHLGVVASLERDDQEKDQALRKRASDQIERMNKRLEECRAALETATGMKREEEKQILVILQGKEKERQELADRLGKLPQILEEALAKKKEEAAQEAGVHRQHLTAKEQELAQVREEFNGVVQAKAAQLAALRQTLDQKYKETVAAYRAREQVLESERGVVEKQIIAAQADMDKARAHWQGEIEKKEQEIVTLEGEIQRQQTLQRQTVEKEQKALEQQWRPLEEKRHAAAETIKRERIEHLDRVALLEKQALEAQAQMQALGQKAKTDKVDLEARYRQEHGQWKARLEQLKTEHHAMVRSAEETLVQKNQNLEELQEQIQQQALVYETRRQEAVQQATTKTRSLQDQIAKLQTDLASARERFPQEYKAREETILSLNKQLADEQARHQTLLARYERATDTLSRRGKLKEDKFRASFALAKEEGSKKIAARESEIAALQANLTTKETERQGELDRLAKQFAEERFQLEKGKEELGWKLKDLNEVAERQLAGRQKEIQFLQAEIGRLKAQRDEQLAQKIAVFDGEKQKWQTSLSALQKQTDDQRALEESTLTAKDQELQSLLAQSKTRMKTLSEEFNQKVHSWRSTNDHLRAQIDQLKTHWTQGQAHWESVKKEKTGEIEGLRQNVAQWEQRIVHDAKEMERVQEEDRQALSQQLRKQEKELGDVQSTFQNNVAEKEEAMAHSLDDIKHREAAAETQWQAALEQWQTDKQALQAEKARFEQDINQLQQRSEHEQHEISETLSRLRMELSFKETESANQQERLQTQMDKELQPLRERVSHLTNQLEQERGSWESRLQAKDEDLRMLKTRLAWRDKRLQDEMKRRDKELEGLRRQAQDEVQKARTQHDQESRQISQMIQEKRAALQELQKQEKEFNKAGHAKQESSQKTLEERRREIEENLKHLTTQMDDLKKHYEPVLKEKEMEFQELNRALETKDEELSTRRDNAKQLAESLRQNVESLRDFNARPATRSGPKSAGSWSSFEAGVRFYQAQRWPEAIKSFQECIVRDPRWGAAYQYLALVYHAQGDDALASATAQRALEQDPANPQLGSWVERLRASLDVKKKAS